MVNLGEPTLIALKETMKEYPDNADESTDVFRAAGDEIKELMQRNVIKNFNKEEAWCASLPRHITRAHSPALPRRAARERAPRPPYFAQLSIYRGRTAPSERFDAPAAGAGCSRATRHSPSAPAMFITPARLRLQLSQPRAVFPSARGPASANRPRQPLRVAGDEGLVMNTGGTSGTPRRSTPSS